jgi:hypothetical protein
LFNKFCREREREILKQSLSYLFQKFTKSSFNYINQRSSCAAFQNSNQQFFLSISNNHKFFHKEFYMRNLLKLSLTALTLFILTGCGSGGSSGGNGIERFMSDFPQLDTSGYTLIYEEKGISYYDYSSSELAKTFNTAISGGDFTLDYINSYYINDNYFYYSYELNNPVSKGFYGGHIWITSDYDSFIEMALGADKSISNSEFADIFGKVDADLLARMSIITIYDGDLRAKFTAYYDDVTGSRKFFDIHNTPDVYCTTDYASYWRCEKDDNNVYYGFIFYFDATGSTVIFDKYLY